MRENLSMASMGLMLFILGILNIIIVLGKIHMIIQVLYHLENIVLCTNTKKNGRETQTRTLGVNDFPITICPSRSLLRL